MLEQKREQRFRLMKALYDASCGDSSKYIDFRALMLALGMSEEVFNQTSHYLQNEGLLKFVTRSDICILHQGVIEVEASMDAPEKPTAHFPAAKILYVGSMTNSSLMVDSAGAEASIVISGADAGELLNALGNVVSVFRDELAEAIRLELSTTAVLELHSELQTIEAQATSPKPKAVVLKPTLESIRKILEGATGSVLASSALPYVQQALSLIA